MVYKPKQMMPLAAAFLCLFTANALIATDAFGYIFGNTINPDEGLCTVAMPPNGYAAIASASGNIIQYRFAQNGLRLIATCKMKEVTYWAGDGEDPEGSPPDTGLRFTPADYDSGWNCKFFYEDGSTEETEDFSVTVTPSGILDLTCFFDLQ